MILLPIGFHKTSRSTHEKLWVKSKVSTLKVPIMTFNGDDWDLGWWFGDDHGMLSQVGGTPEYFSVEESAE